MLVVQRIFEAKRTNLHEKYDYPLLQACPIHGCELADRCKGGELFAGDQVVLHHMNAGY